MFAADYPFEATEEAAHFIDGVALDGQVARRHLLQQCRKIARTAPIATGTRPALRAGEDIMASVTTAASGRSSVDDIVARLERLPTSWWQVKARIIVGVATFFDAFDALAIASILPVIVPLWKLTPPQIGLHDLGRLPRPIARRAVVRLDRRALRPNDRDDLVDRAVRGDEPRLRAGLGLQLAAGVPHHPGHRTGRRGAGRRRLHQRTREGARPRPLRAALRARVPDRPGRRQAWSGLWVVPHLGWQYMFVIGALPALLTLVLRRLLPESPRWLAVRGRDARGARPPWR